MFNIKWCFFLNSKSVNQSQTKNWREERSFEEYLYSLSLVKAESFHLMQCGLNFYYFNNSDPLNMSENTDIDDCDYKLVTHHEHLFKTDLPWETVRLFLFI